LDYVLRLKLVGTINDHKSSAPITSSATTTVTPSATATKVPSTSVDNSDHILLLAPALVTSEMPENAMLFMFSP